MKKIFLLLLLSEDEAKHTSKAHFLLNDEEVTRCDVQPLITGLKNLVLGSSLGPVSSPEPPHLQSAVIVVSFSY